MGRPATVVPEILRKLEPYLEARMAEWLVQQEPREPTLPITGDGKINVRALTLALGLPLSKEQHFYKQASLAEVVNAAAHTQGLLPIGSRSQMDADDAVVQQRIKRIQGESSDLARELAEREAVIERQRIRIATLEEQLRLRDEIGMTLRLQDVR